MSLDNPILVTGAAGRVGGVGRTIVELLCRATCQFARWSDGKTNGLRHCEPQALRSSSVTSLGPRMSHALWKVADASISA